MTRALLVINTKTGRIARYVKESPWRRVARTHVANAEVAHLDCLGLIREQLEHFRKHGEVKQ